MRTRPFESAQITKAIVRDVCGYHLGRRPRRNTGTLPLAEIGRHPRPLVLVLNGHLVRATGAARITVADQKQNTRSRRLVKVPVCRGRAGSAFRSSWAARRCGRC
jgi:hypothetical protein